MACVASKLFYNLETLWLLKADLSRLDAFHIKCLRRICKIPPSFISRVSNDTVLAISAQDRCSTMLQKRQMHLYKKIASLPSSSLIRMLVCECASDNPKRWSQKRKRGRPKIQWASSVFQMIENSPCVVVDASTVPRTTTAFVLIFRPSTDTWW